MDTLIFSLHIVLWPLCIMCITLILLQGGAGDISSAFGGGGQLDSTLGVGASRKTARLTSWIAGAIALVVIVLDIPHHDSLAAPGGKPPGAPAHQAPAAPNQGGPGPIANPEHAATAAAVAEPAPSLGARPLIAAPQPAQLPPNTAQAREPAPAPAAPHAAASTTSSAVAVPAAPIPPAAK